MICSQTNRLYGVIINILYSLLIEINEDNSTANVWQKNRVNRDCDYEKWNGSFDFTGKLVLDAKKMDKKVTSAIG